MIRTFSLVVEGETGAYSAYVLELPSILVTGSSLDEVKRRAQEAVVIRWEMLKQERSPTSSLLEIEVDVPAPDPVTERLNRVYAEQSSELDPDIRLASIRTLKRNSW